MFVHYLINNMKKNNIKHVAIIMDGNGRWAKNKGKSRIYGHRKGVESVYDIINFSVSYNLEILTLYAFSTENWKRPYIEVNELMRLFSVALDNYMYKLNDCNICIKVIGDVVMLPYNLCKKIKKVEYLTKDNCGLKLNIALNYGGKWDILCCIKNIIQKVENNMININSINEATVEENLCSRYLPDIDLIIRTGGEKRLSNFFLWQTVYSEFFFTDVLWPDFKSNDFLFALNSFYDRKRKYGLI